MKTAYNLNQEYDYLKNEISKENLRIQELKAKNDELKQSHDQRINEISKSRNELSIFRDKMQKLKDDKGLLIAKVN